MDDTAPTAGFCSLCQTAIATAAATADCPGCNTTYHQECWDEVGGCGLYGCPQVPATDKREGLEIPASHWGQETKSCPACGKEIQALAVRCRHCAADLGAVAPLTQEAWRASRHSIDVRPGLKKRVIWLSIACALPPLSFLAGPIGAGWWWRHHCDIASLPRMHRTLLLIAVAMAGIQILVFTLAMAFTGR